MKVLRKAFKQELDSAVSQFVNSIDADIELIQSDIKGSLAHAEMLSEAGLITTDEFEAISSGLKELALEYSSGKLQLIAEYEDVHMNVEKQLEAKIGSAAARLHTARSRNDQVALDTRLYTASKIAEVKKQIVSLQTALLNCAQENIDAVMPGYTHLQRAQPVLFSHAMHAFIEMLNRDFDRFNDCKKRVSVSPLGAAALAGTALPVIPSLTSSLLGFSEEFKNSLDAVSDRDFALEFLSAACITSTHLSQLAETLIIWASSEFSFVGFNDNVTTASSLMPNKKNPDPVELVRGKTGSIIGNLVNALITLKALPLGYNRDLQEVKPTVIDAASTLLGSLKVMVVVINSMNVQKATMEKAAMDPFLAATDIAEYLVKAGVAFRVAHEAVSELVNYSRENSKALSDLSLSEFKQFSDKFENDVFDLFDPHLSVSSKQSPGSTGKDCVISALAKCKNQLQLNSDVCS